ELTRATVEAGGSESAAEAALTPAPSPKVAVPATIYASLMSRLDRLGPGAKHVAQIGAVIGREFSDEMVRLVAGWRNEDVEAALGQLADAELVFERRADRQTLYLFKHALVQEAAYGNLLRSRRQPLHARVARVFEERFPATAERQPELIAHHFTQAGLVEKAVEYWLAAGERAVRGSTLVEAITQLGKGLELLRLLPEGDRRRAQELGLQTALGRALMGARGYADPATGHAFARARELCQGVDEGERLLPILYGQFLFYHVSSKLGVTLEVAEETFRLGRRRGERALAFVGRYMMGVPHFHMGNFAMALENFREALALYDADENQRLMLAVGTNVQAMLLAYTAWASLAVGVIDQAVARDQQAAEEVQSLPGLPSKAAVLGHSCSFSTVYRDLAATQRKTGPLLSLCAEQKYPFWLAVATMCRGWAMAETASMRGEGTVLMRQALHTYRTIGSKVMVPLAMTALAERIGQSGKVDDAMALIDEALRLAETYEDRWYKAEMHRIKGELFISVHDRPRAEASLQEAIRVARAQQAKLWELRAATSCAQLWCDQGKREEAHDLLVTIYRQFTEGFITPDLQQAASLLEELHS
ncbi:MAG: hypothetical protein M3Y41_08605, partial [Pseudomonadota bacterium]|nr:hypothetical protein [Pseudomonadota bacterium]